ncbi:MAG TPA: aspartate ammonia-lyase [Candidatus Latescibacteria bacterium]|jgi:hypothetical protein|nr:aspartate ammonia-lyase [Candidatus Latescibacterota bacterium]HOT36247.1 aspartate ammonia-lyase [Candidatus Latescibacterota bacterium]HPC46162.1 aspartate ammonia-lyase [Candidatus Latescibacterota bacterium]HRS95960.1 aspartate ammonia-lyase [Candidatus Latescibacterota bacterium]HRU25148.1 aspartate ammonia-lyase [Candidatus Latescibacterota bacterium]
MPDGTRSGNKISRGNAAQFFVAGELCRRGHAAVVTLGNTPNVDILCSNAAGTRFAHIQVKTFEPGNRTCSVGIKAETDFGSTFFWVLSGIPSFGSDREFEYYIIPSREMARNVREGHEKWLATPGKNGQVHHDSNVRAVNLPPFSPFWGWDITSFRNRWDLIEEVLKPVSGFPPSRE